MCHLYADPARIPSLRCRKALGHREWSQLSLTISDIGLRGLTLLCRGCFVTRFKFCPMTSPWPSPDHAMGYPISGMGTNPARDALGCSLSRQAVSTSCSGGNVRSEKTCLGTRERCAEAQSQIYATLLTWNGEFHYIERTKKLKDRNTTHSCTLITGGFTLPSSWD